MIELRLINEIDYKQDSLSNVLFEDDHPFSFAKLEIENRSFKFSWNSKGIKPEMKVMEDYSIFFVGVDTYVIGYNYKDLRVAFFLNTSSNFKWFDNISNGIAVVTETGVILVNTAKRCTLRDCVFFGDIIVDTKVEANKMKISFLSNDDEMITA